MSLETLLRSALGATFVMATHTHIAHWNIRGEGFPYQHGFLGDLYADLDGAVDGLAEHLRAEGYTAPTSISAMLAESPISDMSGSSSWSSIVTDLAGENATIINTLKEALEAAEEEECPGTANYLADRLDQHGKWAWMLRSSL